MKIPYVDLFEYPRAWALRHLGRVLLLPGLLDIEGALGSGLADDIRTLLRLQSPFCSRRALGNCTENCDNAATTTVGCEFAG